MKPDEPVLFAPPWICESIPCGPWEDLGLFLDFAPPVARKLPVLVGTFYEAGGTP